MSLADIQSFSADIAADGAGTRLTAASVTFGANSSNTVNALMVTAGAAVAFTGLALNSSTNTSTVVTVDGAGSTLTVSGGLGSVGTLSISSGGAVSVGSLSGGSSLPVTLDDGSLTFTASGSADNPFALSSGGGTFGVGSNTVTLSGVLSGSGGLTKTGTGTLTLSGANTYDGTTTVAAGTLLINGSLTSGATVAPGGTLGGSGTIGGAVAVQSGGTLAPGSSPGTLTIASLLMNPGSFLAVELGSPSSDRLVVSGSAVLDGTLSVSLDNGFTPAAGQGFDILDWGGLSGTFSTISLPDISGSGLAWDTSQLYSEGVLAVSPVPEPAAATALTLASAGALLVLRRRRFGRPR